MLSELRLSLRNLSKSRGFAAIAILTLAVGIGSATTIFSALRALVIHPFDYPESDRLAQVWSGDGWSLSPADFLDLYEQMTSFEEFGVYSPQSFNVGEENAKSVNGVSCTFGVLGAFGISPRLGRLLEHSDDAKDAVPVVVISHGLWQNSFGSNPDIIGKGIRLNGGDATVVGVMPASFEFSGPWIRSTDSDIFLPMSLEDNKDNRDGHWLSGVARLNENATVESADAEIKTIGKRLSELYPNSNTHKEFLVHSLHFEMTKDLGNQVWLLFVAVVLVLLVACANVASMLLARSAKRQGEFGVRAALGATKGNLMRLALSESLALALLGAIIGLGLAYGGIEILKAISPASAARKAAMVVDGPVLLFSLGATFVTALLAGLPPVFATLNTSIAAIIRQDARGTVGSRSRHYMLRALVIAQVAVAFILANGAVLFSASYFKLLDENKILDTENVLSAKLSLQGERYDENEERVRLWEEVVQRLEVLPGVISVGLTSKLPLEGGSSTQGLVNDEVYDPSQHRMNIERSSVSMGYFETVGLALLQGRTLRLEDAMTEAGLMGVVINETLANKAWPDRDPIGEVIRGNSAGDPWYVATVVGVVEDVNQRVAGEVRPEMYTTAKGHWGNSVFVNVRSSQSALQLTPSVRAAIEEIDSELALGSVRTLRQVVLDSTHSERAIAGLVNFFMVTALGLVAVGLYGTLSYNILQRVREIGVRRAIGALEADIAKLVLRQGASWVAVGLGIGVVGIFGLTRVLASLVHGMEGVSFQPLVLAVAVVGFAAFIACWLPARRAARLEPLEALRGD